MAKFVFRESFDTYNGHDAPLGFLSRWVSSSHLGVLDTGRFLGRSYRIDWSDRLFRSMDESIKEGTIGFSFKVSGLPSAADGNHIIAGFFNQDINGFSGGISFLGFDVDGSLYLTRGNGRSEGKQIFGRSDPFTVQPNVWYFAEWEFRFDNVDGFSRLYLNGNPDPIIDVSNVDTVGNGGIQEARYVHIGGYGANGSGIWRWLDDMYVWDAPARRGPIRIESLPVNGNGAHQDFTPLTGADNAAMVDDPVPNLDDYVIGTGVGQYDEYTVTNLSSSVADVFEVNLIMLGQQTGSTIRAMALGVDSDGTISKGDDIYMGSGFARYERRMLLNPDGNVPWTKASVDALILRPEITV